MQSLNIILPLALLALAFFLKLLIDRQVDIPDFIQSICELPVDINFLSLSFIVAFTLSVDDRKDEGLLNCLYYVIAAIIIVFLWKRSLKLFEIKKWTWLLLLFFNLSFAGYGLFRSTNLLLELNVPVEQVTVEKPENIEQ